MLDRLHEAVSELLSSHQAVPLNRSIARAIDELVGARDSGAAPVRD